MLDARLCPDRKATARFPLVLWVFEISIELPVVKVAAGFDVVVQSFAVVAEFGRVEVDSFDVKAVEEELFVYCATF